METTFFFITTLIFGNVSLVLFYKWKDAKRKNRELQISLDTSRQMNNELKQLIKAEHEQQEKRNNNESR